MGRMHPKRKAGKRMRISKGLRKYKEEASVPEVKTEDVSRRQSLVIALNEAGLARNKTRRKK